MSDVEQPDYFDSLPFGKPARPTGEPLPINRVSLILGANRSSRAATSEHVEGRRLLSHTSTV